MATSLKCLLLAKVTSVNVCVTRMVEGLDGNIGWYIRGTSMLGVGRKADNLAV
jgi:hypothetical protein